MELSNNLDSVNIVDPVEIAKMMMDSGEMVHVCVSKRGDESTEFKMEIHTAGISDLKMEADIRNTKLEAAEREIERMKKARAREVETLVRLDDNLELLLDALPEHSATILRIWGV